MSNLLTSSKQAAAGRLFFFSNDDTFTAAAKIKRRNYCWPSQGPVDVLVVGRTKSSASERVLLVVSSEGQVMLGPFFKKEGKCDQGGLTLRSSAPWLRRPHQPNVLFTWCTTSVMTAQKVYLYEAIVTVVANINARHLKHVKAAVTAEGG